jgi:Copper chaperone
MKAKTLLLIVMLLGAFTLQIQANDKKKDKKKDKATVTFVVPLKCETCKNHVERSLAYEKGVTDLIVDVKNKTVTIEYETKKTNPQKLKETIEKLGFKAEQKE